MKNGDRVRYKARLPNASNPSRNGQTGTITEIFCDATGSTQSAYTPAGIVWDGSDRTSYGIYLGNLIPIRGTTSHTTWSQE